MHAFRLFLPLLALLFSQKVWASPPDSSDIHAYAGIEIGAKGVKMCVIREKVTPTGQHEIVSVAERTINTELVSLTQLAIINTAWAVRSLLDTVVMAYKIPRKMVFIVVSSGAKLALDQSDKLDEVRESIRSAIDESGREIFYVRPDQEAALMAEGMIAPADRATTALCDIGGGNTKGGRFSGGKFQSFALPYGTRSLLSQVPATDSVPVLGKRLDSLAQARLTAEYSQAAASPAFLDARNLYFVGGIIWIMTTFTYPEQVEAPYVTFTLQDLKRFRDLAVSDYALLSHPAYNKGLPNAAAIEKALNQARNTYDRKAVVTGAFLAWGMASAIAARNPSITFVFDRNAGLSWIRALVRQSSQTGGRPELAEL